MRAFAAALLLMMAPCAWADADMAHAEDPEAPTVGVSIDKTEAHVGDRLTLTVSAVAKSGIAVMLPAKLDTGKLEILDRNDGDKTGRDLGDGRRSHRFVLGVAAYETGEIDVPPLAVTYILPSGQTRSVETEPLTINIRPLVAADEAHPEPQPERPPRSAMVEDQRVVRALKWGGIGLGGAIVLLVAGLLIRRAWRRRTPAALVAEANAPKRAPDAVAIEKLTALRAAGNFGVDGYRPFYFALTEIVREYLGARYGFDALEMTTTEVLDELKTRAEHLVGEGAEVPRFFASCDLVKFAKAGSTDAAALAALDAAQAIVLSTAAPLETAAQSISGPVRLPRPLDDDEAANG
ncbi:MAG TPA: BatD family protein [Polyangia bacterium]